VIWITENLANALRHIRRLCSPDGSFRSNPPSKIFVWADAISINQADDAEKSHQVAMMDTIFKRSAQTYIYLFEETENREGAQAAEVIRKINQTADIREQRHRLEQSFMLSSLESIGQRFGMDKLPFIENEFPILSLKKHMWESYVKLLKQSWFERAWVVQELVPSPKKILIFELLSDKPRYLRIHSNQTGEGVGEQDFFIDIEPEMKRTTNASIRKATNVAQQ
jgi:hypothetical protein